MRCDHEHDDGAYVLGALSPAERAAYERHLATCSFCREAVADIAVLPGLLGRLSSADFERLLDPDFASPRPQPRRTSMPDLVTAAQSTRREERKRLRWRVMGTALAAACLALVVGIGAVFWMGRGATPDPTVPGPTVAMTPANSQVPVTAQINLAGAPGGTKVNLVCAYNRPGRSAGSRSLCRPSSWARGSPRRARSSACPASPTSPTGCCPGWHWYATTGGRCSRTTSPEARSSNVP